MADKHTQMATADIEDSYCVRHHTRHLTSNKRIYILVIIKTLNKIPRKYIFLLAISIRHSAVNLALEYRGFPI